MALAIAGKLEQARLVRIVADFVGLALQHTEASYDLHLETPLGSVVGVFPILRYLADLNPSHELLGATPFEEATTDNWVEFAKNEFFYKDLEGLQNLDETASHSLSGLDSHLKLHTFISSNHITLADITCLYGVRNLFSSEDLTQIKTNYPHFSRWFLTCIASPHLRNIVNASQVSKFSQCSASSTPNTGTLSNISSGQAVDCQVIEGEDNPVTKLLEELNIKQTTYAHSLAMTVEDQSSIVGHLPGKLTKNLFLNEKKYGLFLVTVAHNQKVDMKQLAKLLNLSGKVNLRFGDADLLLSTLGVTAGSVSPFAVINDKEKKVKFALDASLLNAAAINSHPLRNDRTTSVSPDGLLAFVRHCDHEPTIINFCDESSESKVSESKKTETKKPETKASVISNEISEDKVGKQTKKETLLKIDHFKEEDFAKWYTQVVTYSEMMDYYEISGCYILRPWSYSIWEKIQDFVNAEIKARGVQNCYFPLFVTQKALETEKDHVEGFAPEVAWVTKAGENDLQVPIAVRPTSETIMYPAFKNWIRSHRDLPLKLNQWCNVVRWEFKYPTPFLRSREFLWQEGHTVHATDEEAYEMVLEILDVYARVYQELLAIPVIKGRKTEKEKFAGGYITTTVEAYIGGSGRAIQGATSHHLGQNFGKMFKILFEDVDGKRKTPYQTSWGLTTRTLGVMVMAHSDNQGLVLPPRVAPIQVVLIPIIDAKTPTEDKDSINQYVREIGRSLASQGIRIQVDDSTNNTAGWKFNHWEQKGVPIRVEAGPRDLKSNQVRIVRRDNRSKVDINRDEFINGKAIELLETIHNDMYERAKGERDSHLVQVREWKDFVPALNQKNMVLTPFCNETEWEEKVKERSREEALAGEVEDAQTSTSAAAKTLCIPFEQPELPSGTPCFISGKPATCWVLWGRSY